MEEWEDQIRRYRVTNTIQTLRPMQSASRTTIAQFLSLRILYQTKRASRFNAADWGLGAHRTTARQHLQGCPEFQAYLQNVALDAGVAQQGQPQVLQLGIFELPREQQRHVQDLRIYLGQRAITPGSTALNVLPTADEETVNFALVDFLQAICLKFPGVYSRWVPTRFCMRANFSQDNYTAITDGGLSIWGEPENIHALIECKAPNRRDALPSVQLQEASQIVAWLKQEHRPASGDTGRYVEHSKEIEVIY